MFVVLGASGNTGKVVAETLLFLARDTETRIEAVTWKYGPIQGETYINDQPDPEWGSETYIREGVGKFISSYLFENRE